MGAKTSYFSTDFEQTNNARGENTQKKSIGEGFEASGGTFIERDLKILYLGDIQF